MSAVPLNEIVRQALQAAGDEGLTLAEIREALLDIGVAAEPMEISSCLAKMGAKVGRTIEQRRTGGRGRMKVMRYRWLIS